MAERKILGPILLAAGIVVLLVSALADILGLGANPTVFGYKQIAGSLAGIIVAIVGAVFYWLAGRQA